MDIPPGIYKEASSSQSRDGIDLLDKIPNSTLSRPGMVILDIGCGPGNFTSIILERMSTESLLVAIDVDPLMVQSCYDQTTKSFPQHKIKGVVQDFAAPFETFTPEVAELEGTVDLIICNFVLHWIIPKDRSNAINSIKRLLRPGGQAYINIILMPHLLQACDSFEERERFQSILDFPSYPQQEKMWKDEFEEGNFSHSQIKCLSPFWNCKNRREFMLFKKVRRAFMVHAREDSYPSEGADLDGFLELIEDLFVRYHTQLHEKVVGKLDNPEEANTMYYQYVRAIATK